MKDPTHHDKGFQKKVLRSARKEEEVKLERETSSLATMEESAKEHRVSEEGIWYEEYEERLPLRRKPSKGFH